MNIKMNWEKVNFIRENFDNESKEFNMRGMAERFMVSKENVRRILLNDTWVDESYIPKYRKNMNQRREKFITDKDIAYMNEVYVPNCEKFGRRALEKKFGLADRSALNYIAR